MNDLELLLWIIAGMTWSILIGGLFVEPVRRRWGRVPVFDRTWDYIASGMSGLGRWCARLGQWARRRWPARRSRS
ncbi:hypothetical protein [Brachybacterium phenoliresistens]|uniref:hypothetical protein n=1 Tax=Brachybacterium phenoliresistens TaxID=396014 RepID=UPI0031CF79AB